MIGAALAGSVIQAGAASKAAKAQTDAANNDIAFQRETRDLIFDRYQPAYEAGKNALAAYNFEMGLGPRPMIGASTPEITTIAGTPAQYAAANNPSGEMRMTREATPETYRVNGQTFSTMDAAEEYAKANATGGTEYQGYQQSPGYQFRLQEGINALDTSAAARGQLSSGATMKAAMRYGQDYGTNDWSNYMNRLAGLTDSGMAAAGGQAAAATNTAAGVSNAYSNIGNAQAAGAIGVGNAFSSGLNNISSIYGYQNALNTMNGGGGTNAFSMWG